MDQGHALSDRLISVGEARQRLLAESDTLTPESVPLEDAHNRVLAADLPALRTQPPFPVSAMDGYAVRAADIKAAPCELRVIGEAAAGHPFNGPAGPGEAVRIFTGGVVPDGADTILIQENAAVLPDGRIRAEKSESPGRYVRAAGLDFREGEILLNAGKVFDAGALSLAAAGNHATVSVIRRPRVAILATGDELLPPGSDPGPGQIIASNAYGVAAVARDSGAEIFDLGIARDTESDLTEALDRASELSCDVIVTLGGASVGDHDLVQKAFVSKGMTLDFWKIAMRPGKPLMLGRIDSMRVLGLPGNPVSSMVCGHLFLKPLIEQLGGRPSSERRMTASLVVPLPENDRREDYLRARAWRDNAGTLCVEPFGKQDSSMIRIFSESNVLVIRAPFAPEAAAGEQVEIIVLNSAAI
jgi:molybdopterin molybdotransferase